MATSADGHDLSAILGLAQGERITLVTAIPEERRSLTAVVLSSDGMIRRLPLDELISATTRGRTIMTGGSVIPVGYAFPEDDLIVVTRQGYAIRLRVKEVPKQKASAAGSRALRLNRDHSAIALVVAEQGANSGDLVVVSEGSQAKRTPLADYRTQSRDGIGLHSDAL
jgi:DNA gyrase subunit A